MFKEHHIETPRGITSAQVEIDDAEASRARGRSMAADFRGTVESFLGDVSEIVGQDTLSVYHNICDMAGDFDLDPDTAEGFAEWNERGACEADITPILAAVVKQDERRMDAGPLTPLMESAMANVVTAQ